MKNTMKTKYLLASALLLSTTLFSSCEDMFSPAIENQRNADAMDAEPSYAEGFLANAYVLLPYQGAPASDLATDDAVSNDQSNSYLKMATGSWATNNDPMSQWQGRFNAIQYINIFLAALRQSEMGQ